MLRPARFRAQTRISGLSTVADSVIVPIVRRKSAKSCLARAVPGKLRCCLLEAHPGTIGPRLLQEYPYWGSRLGVGRITAAVNGLPAWEKAGRDGQRRYARTCVPRSPERVSKLPDGAHARSNSNRCHNEGSAAVGSRESTGTLALGQRTTVSTA